MHKFLFCFQPISFQTIFILYSFPYHSSSRVRICITIAFTKTRLSYFTRFISIPIKSTCSCNEKYSYNSKILFCIHTFIK